MKQTQAQKSGVLEQGPLPRHQEQMSKQLLNYSFQEKRKEKKNHYEEKEKNPTKTGHILKKKI